MAMRDDDFISTVILRTNILTSSLFSFQGLVLDDGVCGAFYGNIIGKDIDQSPSESCKMSLKL